MAILLIAPALTLYKEAMGNQRASGGEISFSSAAAETSSGLDTLTVRDRIEVFAASFIGRMCGSFPALFSKYYPEVYPFVNGKSFVTELQSFVPRMLWPGKPNISAELNEYSRQVGMVSQEDTVTSAVFDSVSEYYVNFGVVGVLVLSVIHGAYLRVLYCCLQRAAPSVLATAIFLTTILKNPDWFGVVQTATADIRGVPVCLLILYVLAFKSGSSRLRHVQRAASRHRGAEAGLIFAQPITSKGADE
jgi:hypothetical protein